jgi:hypothetical protein
VKGVSRSVWCTVRRGRRAAPTGGGATRPAAIFRGRFLDGFDLDALTSAATCSIDDVMIDRMTVPRREHDGRQEDEEGSEEAGEEEGREEEEVGRVLFRSPA